MFVDSCWVPSVWDAYSELHPLACQWVKEALEKRQG